ncbi:MAG: LptF/LptG family permease [Tannerella sp.]|nr:LptF/LptG family permease [Tannerella sp.]
MKLKGLGLKIVDWYIIRQFLGTFVFSIVLMIAITVVFDANEKLDYFLKPEVTVHEIVFDYYFNFIPYFISLFSPLFIFISAIFLTSNLAGRSEIIAILSNGISFRRLLLPYIISAGLIAGCNFVLTGYVIPPASIARIDFQNKYIKNKKVDYGRNIQLEVEPGVFAYFDSYRDGSKMGYRFSLDRFEGNTLVSRLTASSIRYDSLYRWTIIDYVIRDFGEKHERITSGTRMDTTLTFMPSDFLISENDCQTMTSSQLARHISRQKQRGIGNVQLFEIEYHQRYATILSFFIMTVIGVTLSARRMKGGMGLNIGIGIGLSFSYILFSKITSSFAISGSVSPAVAVWIPNIIYGFITVFLYRRAPN